VAWHWPDGAAGIQGMPTGSGLALAPACHGVGCFDRARGFSGVLGHRFRPRETVASHQWPRVKRWPLAQGIADVLSAEAQ
jgi:hypothetical protein